MNATTIDPAGRVPAGVYAAALNEVNRLRRDVNAPTLEALPPGEPSKYARCPIAHALRPLDVLSVRHGSIVTHHPEVGTFRTPDTLDRFMSWFDAPDYMIRRAAAQQRERGALVVVR